MIKHIVMFKLSENADGKTKKKILIPHWKCLKISKS